MMPQYSSPRPPASKPPAGTQAAYEIPGLDSTTYTTFSTADARIYHSQIGAKDHEWTNAKLRGTLIFGADVTPYDGPIQEARRTAKRNVEDCWFRLLDETTGKPIWMFRIPENGLLYQPDRPFFHTFQGFTRKFGFLFADDDEAAAFSREVTIRLASISPSPTWSPPSPTPSQTLATPERPKNKSRSPSFISKRSKSASPSPPPSLSKSSLKRSKTPVSPSMITLPIPRSFSHVSHVGLAEFGTMEANMTQHNQSCMDFFEGGKSKGEEIGQDKQRPTHPERSNTIPVSRSSESSRTLGFASRMRRKLTSPSFHMF